MKKLLLLGFIALVGFVESIQAQPNNPVRYVGSAPSGACPPIEIQVIISTGVIWTCANGTWAAQTGGGGSGNLTVGTSTITSGTTTRILYDNAGVLGEYTLTGTGTVVVMATSPTLVTPNLGTPTTLVLSSATGLPLTTGVTGNLPVTNLNSGTSASNTTFWRGDATWAVPPGGGVGCIPGGANDQIVVVTGAGTTCAASSVTISGTTITASLTGNVTGNLTGNVTGNITGAVTGNASTATALAANPTDCVSATTYAISIAASGNLGCEAVNIATGITGNLSVNNLDTGNNASSSTFWRGDGSWQIVTALPAGSDKEVQFNDVGLTGADSTFTYDKSTGILTVGGGVSSTGSNSGSVFLEGLTSGGAAFVVNDVAGTSTAYILPTASAANEIWMNSGSATCPTLASGVPTTCEQLVSTATSGTGNILRVSRTISTTSPLGGGGDLSSDRTFTCTTCVTAASALTSGQILAGGGSQAIAVSNLSGDVTTSGSMATTVAKVNGIAYSATAAAHTVQVTTTANTTVTAKVLPDCTDTAGNHINFTQSTDAFSCGTSSSAVVPPPPIDIMSGSGLIPDNSGNFTFQPYPIVATNDIMGYMIGQFADTSTEDCGFTRFVAPSTPITSVTFTMVWSSTVITGDVVWTLYYRVVSGNDTTSLDQTTWLRSLTVTDTAPGAANRRMEAPMSGTIGDFTRGDTVQVKFCRNGAGSDTMAGIAQVHAVMADFI